MSLGFVGWPKGQTRPLKQFEGVAEWYTRATSTSTPHARRFEPGLNTTFVRRVFAVSRANLDRFGPSFGMVAGA